MPALNPIPPPLTPNRVNAALQMVTQVLLGLDPAGDADNANSQVRVGWQQEGQPFQNIANDVVYVRSIEDDDPINRTRDVSFNNTDATGSVLQQVTTYTRVWRIFWTVYGPNAFDRARAIRSGLYTQTPHDILATQNVALYAVMDISAPRYLPEPRDGGQWFTRVDFDCQFNELVTEAENVDAVASSEIRVYTEKSPDIDHPVIDLTVVPPNNLHGTVTDGAGNPVADASVSVVSDSGTVTTTASALGKFAVRLLTPTSFVATATNPGDGHAGQVSGSILHGGSATANITIL